MIPFLAACGGNQPRPGQPDPFDAGPLARPLETYAQLGFIAGPGFFPVIAGFSSLAGPADSTYVLFGMSVPNSALRFQRDPNGFIAEYNVTLDFMTPDSQAVKRTSRRETVRIPTFQETSRTDESIVFQHLVTLPPGTYLVGLEAGDANSSRGFRTLDTLEVPDYGMPGLHVTTPIPIYDGDGRAVPDSVPELILNPRRTVAYGGEAPRIYIEAYHATRPVPVTLSVKDELGALVWSARTDIAEGDSVLRRALVDLPSESLPLGAVSVEVAARDSTDQATTPMIISISDEWLVASYADVLQFLQYIATRAELDSLNNGTPVERRAHWEAFWKRRDPLPATPENEFREEFFQRVRYAAEQFSEAGGQPGWRTERGEVYIVLGPPSFVQERYIGQTEYIGRPNAWEWIYENAPGGRLVLLFLDRNGFGHYELSSSSEAAFRAIAERIKRVEGD